MLINEVEKEGQASRPKTENVQPAAEGQASGSKEYKREYWVQWEQEFKWLRRKDGKMFCDICRKANMSNEFVRGCTTMQKSALNDHKNSHNHIKASRVVNQSMAMGEIAG